MASYSPLYSLPACDQSLCNVTQGRAAHRALLVPLKPCRLQHVQRCWRSQTRSPGGALKGQLFCTAALVDASPAAAQLGKWLITQHGLTPEQLRMDVREVKGAARLVAGQDLRAGQELLELPGDLCITRTDAVQHPVVGELAADRSELVALALWLLAERSQGSASAWAPFLETLPERTESPVLWAERERAEYLQGSPVQAEASSRAAALEVEWASLQEHMGQQPKRYDNSGLSRGAFLEAMTIIFAHAAWLPSAQCFALLPLATLLPRTGREDAAQLDFDLDRQAVRLLCQQEYRKGEELQLCDRRPAGELLLATGTLFEGDNPEDYLTMRVALVRADRLYTAKKQILESLGYGVEEEFPVFRDRMPTQLLSYVRLARIQDPAQLASVSFTEDCVIGQNNEYEVLQLLLGDCRERLSAYNGSMEDDVKKLQRPGLSVRERLGTRLCLSEKRILQGTVDAVRRKLAPIRGIPAKGGRMVDPNQDLADVFSQIEDLPKKPGQLIGGLLSWARGEYDPEWQQSGKGRKK